MFASRLPSRSAFAMQKKVELKLTKNEAAQMEAAIDKCNDALKRIFQEMKKDQVEIEKLGAHTRAILAELKAEHVEKAA